MGVNGQQRSMVGWPDRRFIDLVGCDQPIVQAPMAGAGGAALCAATMRGGAVGSLPCALLSPDQVRRQVAEVRNGGGQPLNLNFFCHTMPADEDDTLWERALKPYYEEFGTGPEMTVPLRRPFDEDMCEIVEELRPEVVSFHFGLPEAALVARVKAAGAVIISSATTPEEARWIAVRGADAVIAQGFEAGGHTARFLGSEPAEAIGLFALVPLIVDAVQVPVIAAGGIADGRGICAALMLGASAVQLGTAYLHTPEAEISDAHRRRLSSDRTVFTNLMTGGLARGLRGRLIDELGAVRSEVPTFPFASRALTPIREAAERNGEFGFGPMWAGQAAPLGVALGAEQLTRQLASDALALLDPRS